MWTLNFFLPFIYEQALLACFSLLCGDVLHCNALLGICFKSGTESRVRDFNIANKAVMYYKPLRSVLAGAFHLINVYIVNQF